MTHQLFYIVVVLSSQGPTSAPTPSFMGLGFRAGSTESRAYAVSADGSVVAGDSSGGFRWTQGSGIQPIGAGAARAISADGSVIAGSSGGDAIRWTQGTGAVSLGPSTYSGLGISGDGSIVVGNIRHSSSFYEPFRWTQGTGGVGLGHLDGNPPGEWAARAISSDGSVIVGTDWSPIWGTMAFRWTESDGMSQLSGQPTGFKTDEATAVSTNGSVIVGYVRDYSGNILEAYRWTPGGGVQLLGDLPEGDYSSVAWGVSGDGNYVVGDGTVGQYSIDYEAFLWDPIHGMRNLKDLLENEHGLDLTGWTLTSARGISADGNTIVGYGQNPSGQEEAWHAVIPEPAVASLATLGVLLAGLRRRRHRARA
jgi:uncharacterized membrane protein